MPSTLTGQPDYYDGSHRRQSSISQNSLPDQLRTSIAAAYSPSRSAVFLPATTFGQPQLDRSGSPAFSGNGFGLSNSSSIPFPQIDGTQDISVVNTDPDDYYRQYQSQLGHLPGGSLRQGAIKTTDPKNEVNGKFSASTVPMSTRTTTHDHRQASVTHDAASSQSNLLGFRSRKSSVKNLVAQINASSVEEVPPVPVSNISQPGSKDVSPVISSAGSFQQMPISNHKPASSLRTKNSAAEGTNGLGLAMNTTYANETQSRHRPLFGEYLSDAPSATSPGYGIHEFRHRRGSEGSPVFTSSPVSLRDIERSRHLLPDPSKNSSLANQYNRETDNTYQPGHRRVSSAAPAIRSNAVTGADVYTTTGSIDYTRAHTRQQNSTSRIPVSTRRASASSGTDLRSSPYSAVTQATPKRSSPRRKPRTPPQIQSPSRRNKLNNISQAPKSPLLRANIIAPPPKISPPLRSSRPRLPVSNATTAASRARMAEKFTMMQKMNNEKRVAARRAGKPPELSDIDLKERRLRITQALSRSLEGQDLRGNFERYRRRDFSSSRTASPAMSERSQRTDPGDNRSGVPALVIESEMNSGSEREFQTPIEGPVTDQQAFMQHALDAMQASGHADKIDDDDSPTLGREDTSYSPKPSPLGTGFVFAEHNGEQSSAHTKATLEAENKNDNHNLQINQHDQHVPEQTSLSHAVQHMRSLSPASPRPESSCADLSDHGDSESVNLILRDTTYLEQSHAVRPNHQTANNESQSDMPITQSINRDSWTSSIEATDDREDQPVSHLDSSSPASSNEIQSKGANSIPHDYLSAREQGGEESRPSTMASDAYTIVNIVLQRHSTNGIVDQQFVDDVYQRVLDMSPYDQDGRLSKVRIEQMCLREIQDREETWRRSVITNRSPIREKPTEDSLLATVPESRSKTGAETASNQDLVSMSLPKPFFRSHKYKSSLDSAEDWADTSPSVASWMHFAHGDNIRKHDVSNDNTPIETTSTDTTLTSQYFQTQSGQHANSEQKQPEEDPDLYSTPFPQVSEHAKSMSSQTQVSPADPFHISAMQKPPQVPRRITSSTQMGLPPTPHAQSASVSTKTSIDEADSPEQRRLRRRRHVIKELVDTEYTYEKDLRVLCDIYKQTASAALSDDDIKVLFGNIEQVQEFSRDFLMLLKQVAKPAYVMERPDRKKNTSFDSAPTRPESSTSTLASKPDNDIPTIEKDRETCIGQAFESSFADMEKIYADYIRNRQNANQRLEAVQKSTAAREWLKECRDNSSDITNAWNLDALLVKPVQRVTKYPLLLRELVEATPEDHPDISFLKRALHEVTEVNIRINDVKKHAELVDQVLNRKRKDSDVRMGLSKAFGRRAEKLKQHVGIAEMYEDTEYNEVKIHYDNNIVQLMVVSNDCSSYGRAIKKWVDKMVEISSAAEAWVDVGHSNHQEAESKLRQFAMVTRGISTIALPDHIENLERRVLEPMKQAVDLMNRFKNDPKGLIQKRDKKLIDYAQAKNRKEKGERVDKKMTERMEQWTALNVEAKERMRKLIRATGSLVQACQANLIQMQMTWMKMVRSKLSAAMGISLDRLAIEDISREWQVDFDFQEASALSLSICNGALLAEAVNMVNFQTPSTTLNGEDSPRQASFSTRRSVSMHSNGSQVNVVESFPRTSGQHSRHPYDNPNDRSQLYGSGFSNNRERAVSAASSNIPRVSEPSIRSGKTPKHVSASAAFGNTSYGRSDEALISAPRLSIDTPSPYIGSLQPEVNSSNRPPSASTFFSATAEAPVQHTSFHRPQQSTSSSIFSSAMPMSDSPVAERQMDFAHSTSTVNRHPQPVPSPVPVPAPALFTAASIYEFNIDRSRREAGFPYLTYVTGEIFDVIGERGELWLARNQDDAEGVVGWIWEKHFCKLAE